MPVRKTNYGGNVYIAGSHVNAYEQDFQYSDGTWHKVITIRIGDENKGEPEEYIDMEPEVAERLMADLRNSLPAYHIPRTAGDLLRSTRALRRRPIMTYSRNVRMRRR